ncbi:DNA repair protein RAD51 homolog 4 isoform X2 [Eucyclogobius newberryi]|uniref:DNA repair protein RAD51 homolog 4 isoform X2 n=1 Tax=Eucyclogobius newberryi TaxID=166745 RepID=UPI003B5C0212
MVVLRENMCPGLQLQLVRDLGAADISTVEELVSADLEALAQKCSVSYKALFSIRRVLLAQHAAFPVSGADLYEELLSSTAILSTGHPRLDELLNSGLYTGELTELSGGPGSGKSQVCFGVSVHIALHLKQSVIFIDTTGGLTASRLQQMLQAEGSSMEEQVSVGGACVRAIIIDSVSAVLSPLLGARYTQGLSLMVQVAVLLKVLVKDFSVAALVTNQVTRSATGAVRPALGASWSHLPRTRLLLEGPTRSARGPGSWRSASLIKSSRQPCLLRVDFDLSWWSRCRDAASVKRKVSSSCQV